MVMPPKHNPTHNTGVININMEDKQKTTLSTTQRLIEENRQRGQNTAELAELFSLTLPDFDVPDQRQFSIWLRRYSKDIVAEGIDRAGEWFNTQAQMIETSIAEG